MHCQVRLCRFKRTHSPVLCPCPHAQQVPRPCLARAASSTPLHILLYLCLPWHVQMVNQRRFARQPTALRSPSNGASLANQRRSRHISTASNSASSSRHGGRFQNEAYYFDSCFLPDGCIVQIRLPSSIRPPQRGADATGMQARFFSYKTMRRRVVFNFNNFSSSRRLRPTRAATEATDGISQR